MQIQVSWEAVKWSPGSNYEAGNWWHWYSWRQYLCCHWS